MIDTTDEDAIAVETEEAYDLATGVNTIFIKLDSLLTKKLTPKSPRRMLPMLPNSPSTTGVPSTSPGGSVVSTGPQASAFNKARLPKL